MIQWFLLVKYSAKIAIMRPKVRLIGLFQMQLGAAYMRVKLIRENLRYIQIKFLFTFIITYKYMNGSNRLKQMGRSSQKTR